MIADCSPAGWVRPKPARTGRRMRTGGIRVAVTGLFVLGLVTAVVVGRPLLLPLLLSGLASALLAPVVSLLQRLHVPRGLGALIVVAGLVLLVSAAIWRFARPATDWIESAPRRLARVEEQLSVLRRPIAKMSAAAQQVEQIARIDPSRPAQEVVVRSPSFGDLAFARAGRVVVQLVTMLALLCFLLAAREPMLIRLARFLPAGEHRGRSMLAHRVRSQMSRYLLTVTAINLCLGLAVAGAMRVVGLPNPLLWGALAAVLVSVMLWGALWGIPGALLAVPILAGAKTIIDELPGFQHMGRLLER